MLWQERRHDDNLPLERCGGATQRPIATIRFFNSSTVVFLDLATNHITSGHTFTPYSTSTPSFTVLLVL